MTNGDTLDGASGLTPRDTELQPGVVVGEYVVNDKIGEGGFGTVFRATHPVIGKRVAIKVLARHYSAQPEMVSRFIAEARAVNQIRNRHIIDIFAFGQLQDGRHYYVMEYLDGQPMDEYLAAAGKLSIAEAVAILRPLARALDAAHAKGIAHRDLKPENIFLVRDEEGGWFPKLLDFGIAKLLHDDGRLSHKTRTGAPIGTPYYMSPEQCRGRDVDHRTDMYAFGIVVYKMLAGRVPFDGQDYMEILMKQLSEEPRPLSEMDPALPPRVDEVVAWLMRKAPEERPVTLLEAVEALEQAARAAGIAVPLRAQSFADMRSVPPVRTGAAGKQATPTALGATAIGETVAAASAAAPVEPPARSARRWRTWLAVGAAVAAAGVAIAITSGRPGRTPGRRPVTRPGQVAPAAPVPAPVGQPAPGPAASRPPALVTVQVSGTPPQTEVYGPRGLLGVAPGPIQLERGEASIQLTFKAAGYVAASREVDVRADGAIAVELAPVAAPERDDKEPGRARRPLRKSRNDLEDPFQ